MTIGVGTLAFDLKEVFVNTLKADSTLLAIEGMTAEAVTYGYGEFGAGQRPRLVVWAGEIEWDEEISKGLGASRRDEFFRMMITIESFFPNDSQLTANNRVKAVMQRIEAIVRNPRWSGLPITMSELKPQMLGEAPADDGRAAVLIMSLHVQARKS